MSESAPAQTLSPGQREVVAFLECPSSYPAHVETVRHIETHISHVFIADDLVYKLKKAVKFDFADFTSLDMRRFYCEEELRLNSRYAGELYLDVVPISRSGSSFCFAPGDEIVDYAVRMNRFDKLFDELAVEGRLSEGMLSEATQEIATLHRSAERKPGFWGPEQVQRTLQFNLDFCSAFVPRLFSPEALHHLEMQTASAFETHRDLIARRQHTHVRAVHGDLHLRNICVYRGKALLFDGIDFNPQLSNCDVWADLAFLIMDLLFRGCESEATLVWNSYLQETDDFEGLQLLDLYSSYRAAVRAMVNCISLQAHEAGEAGSTFAEEAKRYLALAGRCLEARPRAVVAVGGLSGTGKSTLASTLSRVLGAVHIRSDAVRKHLCRLRPSERAPAHAYSEEMTERTYLGLMERAEYVLRSGRIAIVDAVFQTDAWRARIKALATRLEIPFIGLWCVAPSALTKERLRNRVGDISDADEKVLAMQERHSIGELTWHSIDTSRDRAESAADATILIRAAIDRSIGRALVQDQ